MLVKTKWKWVGSGSAGDICKSFNASGKWKKCEWEIFIQTPKYCIITYSSSFFSFLPVIVNGNSAFSGFERMLREPGHREVAGGHSINAGSRCSLSHEAMR
jgi:hypothetical protein